MTTHSRIFVLVTSMLFIAGLANAGQDLERKYRIGPAAATLAGWGRGDQAVSISSAPASGRICLTALTYVATTTSTLRLLDGGTTVYSMALAANAVLAERWSGDDMCGSSASKFHIALSTGFFLATPNVPQNLNYTGFAY